MIKKQLRLALGSILKHFGYALTKTHKSEPSQRNTQGLFLAHESELNIYQHASSCQHSQVVKEQFKQKLKNNDYPLESFACSICEDDSYTTVATSEEGFGWGICRSCGLLQCHRRLPTDKLNEFYISGEYQIICMNNLRDDIHYQLEYEISSLYFIDIFNKFKLPLKNARILEIGCGSGGILRALQDNGATVFGFDLDPHRIEVCKKYIKDLYSADALDPKIQFPEKIDYIILSNILEHLSNPKEFLRNIREKLKSDVYSWKNASVLIDVPNLEGAAFYSKESFSKFLHIAHLWYFNAITIERLLNAAGFTVEKIISRNSNFTVIAKPAENSIENKNNAYWNSISSINIANYITDPNNFDSKIKSVLEKYF